MAFRKWTSIEKFSDVRFLANKLLIDTPVIFRGKIKLHGTNAAMRVENGQLVPQKRSSDIPAGSDNAGFASWLRSVKCIAEPEMEGYIFHGEWAGPGVQKGDAICQIPFKHFFLFSATQVHSTDPETGIIRERLIVEPDEIRELLDKTVDHDAAIRILPWQTDTYTVNLLDADASQEFMTEIMDIVDNQVAKEDPYVKEHFDVSGPGEGMVFYGFDQDEDRFRKSYIFKVKSEAHTVMKTKTKNRITPEKPEGMDDFIDMFFTENRFQQMLQEHFDGVANVKQTGPFIGTVMKDVSKESVNEISLLISSGRASRSMQPRKCVNGS